jgi:hypothetical protein
MAQVQPFLVEPEEEGETLLTLEGMVELMEGQGEMVVLE